MTKATTRAGPEVATVPVPAPKGKAKAKGKPKEETEAQKQRDEVTRNGEAFFQSASKHMEENQVAIRQEQERLRHLEEQQRERERDKERERAKCRGHISSSLEQMKSYDLSDDELLLTAHWRPPPPAAPLGTHDANTDTSSANKNKTRLDKIKATLRKSSRNPKDTAAARQKRSVGNVVLEKGSGLEGIKATMRRKHQGSPEKRVSYNDVDEEKKAEAEERKVEEGKESNEADDAIRPRTREESGDINLDHTAESPPPPPPSSQGRSAGTEFFAKMNHAEDHRQDEAPIPPSSADKKVTALLQKVRSERRDLDQLDLVDSGMCMTDAERARLGDLVDQEDRCPICDSALPLDLASASKEYLRQYHRVKNPRLFPSLSEEAQIQFCALHDAESQWIPLGRMRGYPDTIDWQQDVLGQLDEDWIAARIQHVAKVPTVSPIYTSHAEYVGQNGRDAWVQAVRHGKMGDPFPGFFGIIGKNLLDEYFKQLDKDGTLRIGEIPSDFMTRTELLHNVLVPEAATLLIMAGHLGWSKTENSSVETFRDVYQRANAIREQSILYGQNKFDDADGGTAALVTLKRHRAELARRARPEKERQGFLPDPARIQASPKSECNAASTTKRKRKRKMEETDSVVDLTVDTEPEPASATRTPSPIRSGSSVRRASQADDTAKKRKKQHKVEGPPESCPASPRTCSKRSKETKDGSSRAESSRTPSPTSPASQDWYTVDDPPFGSQEIAELANIESSAIKGPLSQPDTTPTQLRPHTRLHASQHKGGSQSTAFSEFDEVDFDLDDPSMAAVRQLVVGKAG